MKTLLSIVSLFFFSLSLSASGISCIEDALAAMKRDVRVKFGNVDENTKAKALAKRVHRAGIGESAYMVDWKFKPGKGRDIWNPKGNMLVMGVKQEDLQTWYDTVGKKSFGLMVNSQPWNQGRGAATAYLRIKNFVYSYSATRDMHSGVRLLLPNSSRPELRPLSNPAYTEITFEATDEELEAMIHFVEKERSDALKAHRNYRTRHRGHQYTHAKDQNINPNFDDTAPVSKYPFFESCAGACTAFFNERWIRDLAYTYPDAPHALTLATLAVEKGIEATHVAKNQIYVNFRNPNASAMTVFALPQEWQGQRFIDHLSTSPYNGMMGWVIPNAARGKRSSAYTSNRTALSNWVRSN